jgi:hypothetical protein
MTTTTYALLIYRTAPPAPAGDRAQLAPHRALQAEVSARGELHAVAQLRDVLQAKVVRPGAHEVTDGPFIETKEWLVGFYLLDCASEEEALQRARALCTDGAHAVEVRPVAWRWKP